LETFIEHGFSNQILAGVFQFYNERHNNQRSFLAYDSKYYRRNENLGNKAYKMSFERTEICLIHSGIFVVKVSHAFLMGSH
jgi:hypothetical protein